MELALIQITGLLRLYPWLQQLIAPADKPLLQHVQPAIMPPLEDKHAWKKIMQLQRK
jgi:hypothetical protein